MNDSDEGWESKAHKLLYSPDKEIIIENISIKDEFDDVDYGEFGFWARICKKHSRQEKYQNLGFMNCEYDAGTGALCDVHGCRNKAAFYIDFFNDPLELQVIFGRGVNCRYK